MHCDNVGISATPGLECGPQSDDVSTRPQHRITIGVTSYNCMIIIHSSQYNLRYNPPTIDGDCITLVAAVLANRNYFSRI